MAKQKSLPGLEDKHLKDLEQKADEYVEVRDKRMTLTKQEVVLQADLLAMMKKHRKTEYIVDGLSITVVPEHEKVKVKRIKESEEEEE